MSASASFTASLNAIQRRFDPKRLRERHIPANLQNEYDLEWQETIMGVPGILAAIILQLQRHDPTMVLLSPPTFIVNFPLKIEGYDHVIAIVQMFSCAILKVMHPGLAPESLVFFAISCGSTDNSLIISATKLAILTSPRDWRVTVFSFVLFVFPLEGLGYRVYVSYYLKQIRYQIRGLFFTKKDLDREIALFFWILPFGFLFAVGPHVSMYHLSAQIYAFSTGLFSLATLVFYFNKTIKRYLERVTEVRIKYADAKQRELNVEGLEKEQSNFRMLVLLASGAFFNLLVANKEYLLGAPFFLLFFLSLFDYKFPKRLMSSRFVLIGQVVTVLLIVALGEPKEVSEMSLKDNLIFLACLSRAFAATCAFNLETMSSFVTDGAIGIGLLVLFSRYPFPITYLYVTSVACFFIEVFTRTGSKKLILKEREGQNFLDHAIKQKFAGTGTALDIALADEMIRKHLSPETLRVMQVALNECQLGSFLCHEATLKRQILDGTFTPKPTTRQLISVIDEWRENWKETEIDLSQEDGQLFLSTDWVIVFQILQGIHSRGEHHNRSFYTRMVVSVTGKSKLVVQIHMVSPGHFAIIRSSSELFAECLNGKFTFHHGRCKLVVPVTIASGPGFSIGDVSTTARTSDSTSQRVLQVGKPRYGASSGSDSERLSPVNTLAIPERVYEVPDNLVFAVLDDSTMIRVNLRFTLLKGCHASPASIFLGETEAQAVDFVQQCLQLQPDICILDENLDYTLTGGSLILGSNVADDLRTAGYRGLIVLHSANELLRDTLDYSIIDGFIMKGANRVQIKNELGHLLFEHRSKRIAAL